MSPIQATPRISIGIPNKALPATPPAIPTSSRNACFVCPAQALIVSAAATPGGHGSAAGNISVSNVLYKMVASMMDAIVAPTSIGTTSPGSPSRNGMPIARIKEFAAQNVAPEILVCTRFWTLISLNFLKILTGILEIMIANSAPIIDVFVLIPIRTMISRPRIEPRTASMILSMRTLGSNALGCCLRFFSFSFIFFTPSHKSTRHCNPAKTSQAVLARTVLQSKTGRPVAFATISLALTEKPMQSMTTRSASTSFAFAAASSTSDIGP